MKRGFFIFAFAAFVISGISFFGFTQGHKKPALSRAQQNDTVWVLLDHVKPDKREQYEKFVHEIFWPTSKSLSEEEQKTFRQTRFLHPTAPEKDGTYTYAFIMDPKVPYAAYSFYPSLVKHYGKEKAKEYMKMYLDSVAGEQTEYSFTQSDI